MTLERFGIALLEHLTPSTASTASSSIVNSLSLPPTSIFWYFNRFTYITMAWG